MLKKLKPTTPSQRNTIILNNKNLNKKPFLKELNKGFLRAQGRNNQGKITVRHRGGGHKRVYRKISFKRIGKKNVQGFVKSIEYDPNRSSHIAAIVNNEDKYYILATKNLKVGDSIDSGKYAKIKEGNTLPLKNMPLGSIIHNIALKPFKGGQLSRSSGSFGQLLQKNHNKYAKVRLPSGEHRLILLDCEATLGVVSNIDYKNKFEKTTSKISHTFYNSF